MEGKPFTLRNLNKPTGRNFSLCDENNLTERSPIISSKGLCVGLTWGGTLMFLWNKFAMELAVS